VRFGAANVLGFPTQNGFRAVGIGFVDIVWLFGTRIVP